MTALKKAFSGQPRPGEYVQLKGELWGRYLCPRCGGPVSISKQLHSVKYDGSVEPTVKCPHSCDFVDSLGLEDWVPEAKASA